MRVSGTVVPLSGRGIEDQPALAVRDGIVQAVGRDALAGAGPAWDFGDRPVLPGFVDPHAHVEVAAAARYAMADCRAPTHRTIEDVLAELSEHAAARAGDDGWIVGQGNLFFDQKLEDGRLPTRQELDRVSRSRPIALRAGGHTTVLNSRALELADVTRFIGKAGLMGGAVVQLDSGGEPTGVVSELDAALGLPVMDPAELRVAVRDGVRELFTRFGVTTVGEISDTADGVRAFDELSRAGEIALNMRVYLWVPGTFSMQEACSWREHLDLAPDGRVAVRGLKLFADGGYSARNAATRTAYLKEYALRPGSRGKINLNRRQVAAALQRTAAAGLQLAVHANGERSQEVVCQAAAGGPSAPGLPPRIEHAGNLLTDRTLADRWRAAGIVPMPQPVFLYNFGDFFPTYLGRGGETGRFPFRHLLDEGWELSGSSDVHLGAEESQTNPLFGVWCCVARRSFFGAEIEPEQAIGVEEALLMHTLYAADAVGERERRGSLEPGKVADLIVLDRDPRTVPVDEIPKVNVDFVFSGGELVYTRDGAAPPSRSDEEGAVHG
jgi:predicted amidohydrolase YtcJ